MIKYICFVGEDGGTREELPSHEFDCEENQILAWIEAKKRFGPVSRLFVEVPLMEPSVEKGKSAHR